MSNILFLGILSAYALWPTIGTVKYRQDAGQIPPDISHYDALLAVDDCDLLGHEAILETKQGDFSALVFDCAGQNSAAYFSNGNDQTTPFKIAGEVDYHFWIKHPELIGTLVTIRVEQ